MNQDPLFQVLFNTAVPRIIFKPGSADFIITDYNQAFREVTGLGERNLRGRSLWAAFNLKNAAGEEARLLPEALNQSIATKAHILMDPFRYDVPVADEPGKKTSWWQLEIIPVVDAEGEVSRIMVTTNNITEHILNQKAHHLLEARAQDLTEELAATNEELLASNEDLQKAVEQIRSAHVEILAFNEDLENKVAARTDELSAIIMNIPVGLALISGEEMRVEMVNKELFALWQKDESIIGKTIGEAFPELSGQGYMQLLQNVYHTGESYKGTNAPVTFLNAEGKPEIRYRDFSYTPIRNRSGEVYSILVITEDVTERHLIREREQQFNEEITAINEELSASIEEQAATNEELNESQLLLTEKIQQLNDYNLKLTEAEERQRFLLNAIPQQVWTASPDGSLNYVNKVVCDDFGQTEEQIIRQGWDAFIHPEDIHDCLKKWTVSLQTAQEYLVEFRLRFKDSEYHWHLARAIPLIENGKVLIWIGTNTNIELQKANELRKDEFISIASHELKTPLTSIKAYNQLNLRKNKDESMVSNLTKVADQTVRLEKLINDLLDVTKINAGKMAYDFQTFNFQKMLSGAIESAQNTSETHSIILEGSTDVEYTGDAYRLEQVVNNFLSNALKYSPNGEKIIVKGKLSNDHIIVSVQDFGIGIAPESLGRLFERYFRVDNNGMRFEGLGLGLFISSEILKRHQGSFWIESEPGKGSTFYFRLPMDSSKAKSIEVRTDTFYRDNSIVINCNQSKSRLDVSWIGFQNMESIQNGYMVILEMMQSNGIHKLVNDYTPILGSWRAATAWLEETWFPRAEIAGLKTLGWVYSPLIFSQLSAQKAIAFQQERLNIQYFNQVSEAEAWVNAQ